MKKTILLLICFMLFSFTVSADSVFDTTKEILDNFNIELLDNTDIIITCKNYAFIDSDEQKIIATALQNGLICPIGGIIEPKSDDLTPVYNGLTSYFIKNPEYKLIAGKYDGYKIGGVLITDTTFCIDEPNKFDIYNVAVDKQNNAKAVWKASEVKLPTLYKGKIYIYGDKEIVLYDVYRYSYNIWIKATMDNEKISTACGDILCGYTEDEINLNFMDKEIYFIGDGYENTIKPLYFEF